MKKRKLRRRLATMLERYESGLEVARRLRNEVEEETSLRQAIGESAAKLREELATAHREIADLRIRAASGRTDDAVRHANEKRELEVRIHALTEAIDVERMARYAAQDERDASISKRIVPLLAENAVLRAAVDFAERDNGQALIEPCAVCGAATFKTSAVCPSHGIEETT